MKKYNVVVRLGEVWSEVEAEDEEEAKSKGLDAFVYELGEMVRNDEWITTEIEIQEITS